MTRLRLATRGSQLALTQSGHVARQVEAALRVDVELVEVRTTGDRLKDVSLAKLGGKGLFIKEIEEALLEGAADLAVHSAKDLPVRVPDGLVLAAFPERADARDALLTSPGRGGVARASTISELARGARVGTGSVRRSAQLRALRDDLEIRPLRGNVTTRVERLDAGDFDAVVLACAGLDRLGLSHRIDERIPATDLLPAIGQGVLAIQARAGDLAGDLAALTHAATRDAVLAERGFLAALEGDCNLPLAAASDALGDGRVRLRGLVASLDGRRIVRGEAEGSADEVGAELASLLLARGADEILAVVRAESGA